LIHLRHRSLNELYVHSLHVGPMSRKNNNQSIILLESECVGFYVLPDTVKVISGTAFPGKNARTHNNETKGLTCAKFNLYETQNLKTT